MSKQYRQPPSKPVVVKPSESTPQITQADLELLMGITVPLPPVELPPEEIEEEPEAAEPEEPAESEEIMAKEPATAPFKLEPPPVMSMIEAEPVPAAISTTVATEVQIALPLMPPGVQVSTQNTVAARIVLPPKPLVMAGSDRDQCQRELRQMDQAVEMFVAFARRIDCPAFLAKGRELEAFVDGCRLDWEQGTDFRKRGL